jgi:hypothetical protein
MTTLKDLTPQFRHVRLLLARGPDHPAGDREEGYDLLVPLDGEGRLDAAEWKTHQAHCRVRHFQPGGQWYFDYVEGDDGDDEIGFRFGEERFVTGEYVSVGRGEGQHTYQVARVEKP